MRGRSLRKSALRIAALAMIMSVGGCYYMDSDDDGAKDDGARGAIVSTKGDEQTRRYALSGFTGVLLAGPDDIIIRKGDSFSVTATGPAATLEKLVVRVDGETLEIRRRHSSNPFTHSGGSSVRITVTLPALHEAVLAGSGSMDSDLLTGDASKLSVAGSGTLQVRGAEAGKIDLAVAGSGDLSVAGRARQADVTIAGSGSLKAATLATETADISVAGSGDVAMQVSGKADVSVVGSGDVTLTGGAQCTTSRMGSGEVNCS